VGTLGRQVDTSPAGDGAGAGAGAGAEYPLGEG